MRKNSLILIIGLLVMSVAQAQGIAEALQYSQQEIRGTARYRALSGAFGALGGDISALADNPAGSAVFVNSYGSLTISSSTIRNNATYFGDTNLTKKNSLNFNQVGAVFVFNNADQSSGINKLTLGLSYNQTADNRDRYIASGIGNTSISDFFIGDANGFQLQDIQQRSGESFTDAYLDIGDAQNLGFPAQQAFLGLAADVIRPADPDDDENVDYLSNLAAGPFDQQYTYISTGFNGKFTANLGLQIDENYYLGLNLNSHFISSREITEFSELDNDNATPVQEILFTNELSTLGNGFSLNIGGIAKVSDEFRLGLSYESPTWYSIEEEFSQRLVNIGADFTADPRVVSILPNYQLRTPGKVTGSAAIIFGKQGLISFDYSYKDYTTTKFSSDLGDDFLNTNTDIKNTLKATSAVRIGGEYRYQNWSYRAGYRYEDSPFVNDTLAGDISGYSLGLGYNFGKIKLDFAYDHSEQQRSDTFYPSQAFTNSARINNEINSVTATIGLNF